MSAKISVIIITHNRADLLSKAMDSVLTQTYREFELLIIDDASTDNTEELVLKYSKKDSHIKYYKNKTNLGISKSRNRGVFLSGGEYIAMLDSDDYWIDKEKLGKQKEHLDKHQDLAIIGTAISCVDEKGLILKEDIYFKEDKEIREKMLLKNQFAQSSVLFRKDVFDRLGGYDESLDIGEDFDLWLKMGEHYKLANLANTMVAYLVHSRGVTKKRKLKTILETDRIVRRYKNKYPNYCKARIKTIFRLIKILF